MVGTPRTTSNVVCMTSDSGGGLHWTAHGEPGDEDVDRADGDQEHVTGAVLRFMGDHGVDMPLWDEEGPLPNDPSWLSDELGLSRELIGDLAAWAADWETSSSEDPVRPSEWVAQRAEHAERGSRLFERLRSEAPEHLEVVNGEPTTS